MSKLTVNVKSMSSLEIAELTGKKLEAAGCALYGKTWQTQLSANLVNSKGNPLDHRRLQHWAAGNVPVPEWIWPQIKVLAEQRKKEIEDFLKHC